MRWDSIFLVLLFLLSFSEMLIPVFNYIFVFSALIIAFLYFNRLVLPRNLRTIIGVVLIVPLFQYVATGNYAGKWMLNFSFYCFSMIAIVTLISHMRESSYVKINSYLRNAVFGTVSAYVLYPIFEHGVIDSFMIDRNYLYASANSLLPPGVLVKQKMSALVVLYIVIIWKMIRSCSTVHLRLLLYVLLIFAVNMLLGSRSQTIGMLVAVLLITAGNSHFQINLYAGITTLLFGCFLYLLTSDIFMQLSALDIRIMLFHAAAVSFFEHMFSGIGLFYLPQYLEENNDIYFSLFYFLYPESYSELIDFPTGLESSFMQFSLELGVLSLVLLYFSTNGLLRIYSSIGDEPKYFVFFIIAYVFSSLFEDNLTQPSFYVMVSILLGLQTFQRRHFKKAKKIGIGKPGLNHNIGFVR